MAAVKRQLVEVPEAHESSHQVPALVPAVLAVQKFSLRPQKKNKLTESKGKIAEISVKPLRVGLIAEAQSVRRQVLVFSVSLTALRSILMKRLPALNSLR